MPRTRFDIDRDEKIEDILTVARRQLADGGYSALSIKGIARELGIAQNAVHWYFPTRDHLFVATLRAGLEKMHSRKPPVTHDFIARAIWIIDRLAEFHPLIVAMHERSRTSEVVAEFDREVTAMLQAMLHNALSEQLPPADAEIAAEAFGATVEGILIRGLPSRKRAQLVRYTLERLINHGSQAKWPTS